MPLNYTRLITKEEEDILKHSLIDIKKWIDDAITGKINNTLTRAVREYQAILVKEGATQIPVNEASAFNSFKGRPDYKNREQRDQAEEAKGNEKVR